MSPRPASDMRPIIEAITCRARAQSCCSSTVDVGYWWGNRDRVTGDLTINVTGSDEVSKLARTGIREPPAPMGRRAGGPVNAVLLGPFSHGACYTASLTRNTVAGQLDIGAGSPGSYVNRHGS